MTDNKFMKEIRKKIQTLKHTKKRYTLDELFTDGTSYMPVSKLKIPAEIRDLIRHLHPELKQKLRAALANILNDPSCRKALKIQLERYSSLRVGRNRIIYRIIKDFVEIVAIDPHQTIYEETTRQLLKDQEKPGRAKYENKKKE